MRLLFYDHRDLAEALEDTHSVFLAGPTARTGDRTAWRAQAIDRFAAIGFEGALIVPEFEKRRFEEAAPIDFAEPQSPIASMRASSYNTLAWETTGIERATIVLFWMPFSLEGKGSETWLPGFTTRSEVSREIARAPERLVLGMPHGAHGSSHIRYHAYQAGMTIHATLDATVVAALRALRSSVR